MPQQINGKINIGLVMSKRTGSDVIDAEELCEIFNTTFEKTSPYLFKVGWNTVDDLKRYVKNAGVSMINELDEITVFDDGFTNSIESVKMINDFISLEEVMNTRGVRAPKLILATTHQGLFDLFKKDLSPEGHELFSYVKTQIVRVDTDKNGDISLSDMNTVFGGHFRDSLSIKNQYHDREDVAREEMEKLNSRKMNKTADIADKIKKRVSETDEKARLEEEKRRAKNPVDIARARQAKVRAKMKETFSKDSLSSDTKKSASGKEYDPNSTTNETGVSVDRQTQHGRQQKRVLDDADIEGDEFFKLRHEFNEAAREVKQNSNLNFDSKIFNDSGKILIGGLSQSGTSSVIANLAQYYAMMDKKVLVINISDNDHITRYFKNFIPRYKRLGRRNSLSTKFSKSLSEISVPVKPNLELISDHGVVQKDMTLNDKLKNYSRIIRFSDEYQIVLIDAGTNFEQVLLNTSMNFLDDTIIITTQDDLNEVPLDLIRQPYQFMLKLKNLKHPIGFIINKIQYQVTNESLNKSILKLPIPLDTSRLLGSIGYQEDWFQQRLSGELSVTYNTAQRITFHDFAKKIILKDVI